MVFDLALFHALFLPTSGPSVDPERLEGRRLGCQSAFNPLMEWAPGSGQGQAAGLTVRRVC